MASVGDTSPSGAAFSLEAGAKMVFYLSGVKGDVGAAVDSGTVDERFDRWTATVQAGDLLGVADSGVTNAKISG